MSTEDLNVAEILDDPRVAKALAVAIQRMQQDDVENRKERARKQLHKRGHRLMHRRNNQFWIIPATPMTLDAVEQWILDN